MNTLQTCPPHWSDVSTLLWEIQKSFSTLLFIYFRLFALSQKKTNRNCCTAALAAYLLLFNASYYLHSPSTASRAHYRRNACIDMDVLRLAAVVWCDMGWISAQHGVLCNWLVSKKSGSLYPGKRLSLWTLAVTLLAWHSSCHTSQPVLFRATGDNPQLTLFTASNTWKNTTNLHTHTHTRLTTLCPGLPQWAGTRKVKSMWILLKQKTVSGSGISWAICKSAPRSRQITMPAPHCPVFSGRMPFLPPNQQCQSTEGKTTTNLQSDEKVLQVTS